MWKNFFIIIGLFLDFIIPLQSMEKGEEYEVGVLIDREPFEIKNLKKIDVVTGKKNWDAIKEQYKVEIHPQIVRRHEPYRMEESFDKILGLAKDKEAWAPILIKETGAFDNDITLQYSCAKETLPLYHLFVEYNRAVMDIVDTMSHLFTKMLYVRGDLVRVRDFLIQTISFFKQSESIIKTLFGVECAPFDKENIYKELEKQHYTPAQQINSFRKSYLTYIKEEHNNTVGIYEFINYYSRFYALIFNNTYCAIQAHLDESKNKETLRLLNRKNLKGKVEAELFDFSTCDLPTCIYNPPKCEIPTQVVTEKTKKKRKKRKSAAAVNPILSKGEIPTVLQEVYTPNTNPPMVKERIMDVLEQAGEKEGLQQQPIAISLPDSFASIAVPITATAVAIPPLVKKAVSPSSLEPINSRKNEVVRLNTELQQLYQILSQYDNGAHAGMKTRHFLRFATALNDLGYFKDFQANEKQVRISIPSNKIIPQGMVTTMHTNHKSRGKDQGITAQTAKKMNEVIEVIEKSVKEQVADKSNDSP